MCGRFVLHSPARHVASVFGARVEDRVVQAWQPSFNIAPTRTVLGVRERDGARVLEPFRWGLVPSWAHDLRAASRAFNARAESAARRPMFRGAFARRRLLVPADGFYEWTGAPGGRQPFYFTRRDGSPLALAGLWEPWRDPTTREWLLTCTILTTAAGDDVGIVHDRQPVVLEEGLVEAFLDEALTDPDAVAALLGSSPPGTLEARRVGPAVGSSTAEGPQLILAVS